MLFLVPDNDFDTGNSAPPPDDLFEQAAASAKKDARPEEAKAAAFPKEGGASGNQQDTSRKVQLDLDDAPFLEMKEEEPAAPPKNDAPVEMPKPNKPKPEPEPGAKKKLGKKQIIKIAGAAVLLIVIAIGAKMFLFGGEKPPDAPAKEEAKEEGPIVKVIPTTPPVPDAPKGPAFTVKLDPFWIEQRGPEGEIRFLLCQFSIPVETENLNNEIMSKTLVIRDSLYYYLKNRPMTFLTDSDVMNALKADVAGVINENLSAGKVGDIYIEEYRISGQ